MSTEGDLVIIVLPFAKLAASTRAANLVTRFFCKLHLEYFLESELRLKNIQLYPIFFFSFFNATSIKFNNISLFAPFLRKLYISARSLISGLFQISHRLLPRKNLSEFLILFCRYASQTK